MADYAAWIAEQKRAAIARGGKPLRNLPGPDDVDEFPHVANRKPGEIVNPVTGEIVTDCLTIAVLSEALGITSFTLGRVLVDLGCAVLVLSTKEVPMECAPHLTKPRYEHVPAVTRRGVEEGLVIPIMFRHGGRKTQCILITPKGQEAVRAALVEREAAAREAGKVRTKQKLVSQLLETGLSQAAIVRKTGLPKQTVSRIVKTLPTI